MADRADGGVEVDAPLPPTIDGLYVDGWQLWAQETGTTVALSKMILRSFRSPSLNNTIRILSTGKAGGFELKPERELSVGWRATGVQSKRSLPPLLKHKAAMRFQGCVGAAGGLKRKGPPTQQRGLRWTSQRDDHPQFRAKTLTYASPNRIGANRGKDAFDQQAPTQRTL